MLGVFSRPGRYAKSISEKHLRDALDQLAINRFPLGPRVRF
jgi:hypothetical protein